MRDDLIHLTPEALAQLSNAGLVKRAVRELAAGYRPQLAEDDGQTLTARFDDGIACEWPRGSTLHNARCSCGAAGVCRHRLIVALAYRAKATGTAPAGPSPAGPSPASAPPMLELAGVSDDALARVVPAPQLREAERTRAEGIAIELRRRAAGEPCDTARLPHATVRYWAGGAIEAARCDCVRATGCQHVALGVWAFREAQRLQGQAPVEPATAPPILTVRLGPPVRRHSIDPAPFEQAVHVLLQQGVLQGTGPLAQGLTAARTAAAEAPWIALLLDELESWADAFARRSTLYEATHGVDLVAELGLRLAAGPQPGQAAAVLGAGQPAETALDRLRLIALGARTRRDGERRWTDVVLADPDTGTRLALRHDWRVPPERESEEAALRAVERVAPGVLMEALAQSQLLAQQASRRADGSLRLARARSAQNSLMPQPGDWSTLGSPLRWSSLAALCDETRAYPVAALQPRHAARRFVVFSPRQVVGVRYDANAQTLWAALADDAHETLLLQRSHQRHTPHALDALAGALEGRFGALRHVAGTLDWHHGVPRIEPWALMCDRSIVPDFAGPCGALKDVLLGSANDPPPDGVTQALDRLAAHLGAALHHGARRLPPRWRHEGERLVHQLSSAGLAELSQRLRSLQSALAAEASPPAATARAFMALAALRQLHQDAAQVQRTPAEAPTE